MLSSSSTCRVFHGTNLFLARVIQYHGIWLDVQRLQTDFSSGFYVTLRCKQAKKWAIVRAAHPTIQEAMLRKLKINEQQYLHHPDTRIPVYLVYELDLKKLRQLHGKVFPLPHQPSWSDSYTQWNIFVKRCRSGLPHSYDYVYGPVSGRHDSQAGVIKLTRDKEQLSLNSHRAVDCLSQLMVIGFSEF